MIPDYRYDVANHFFLSFLTMCFSFSEVTLETGPLPPRTCRRYFLSPAARCFYTNEADQERLATK